MGAIVFGLFCVWAGYRWGRASAVAIEFEHRFERENEEFLDRLRSGSPP